MVPVAFLPVEPDARRDDDFLRVFVEPRRPPGESAVGDDVVAAVSHQFQIEVAGAAVIDIHMDMGQGGPQVLPGPFYVVRKDEVTQGFLRSACRPQPSFHFSHAPEIVFQRWRRKVGVGEVIRSADVQGNGAA